MILVKHFWISIPNMMNTFYYKKIVKLRLSNLLQMSIVQKKAYLHLAMWFWKPLPEKGIWFYTHTHMYVYIYLYIHVCVCIYMFKVLLKFCLPPVSV